VPVTLPPASGGDERSVLTAFLQRQRDLVGWKLDGLSDDDARSVATSTGLTVHGLVRHLENVERSWLRDRTAGEHGLRFDWTGQDPEAELHVPEDVRLVDLLEAYRAESRRCDEVVSARSLDDAGVRTDKDLRWVLHHLVEETARHLGHLDLLCELADGRTGEEPEGLPTS
jgi:uncharacterized damage-inducible protein DinB